MARYIDLDKAIERLKASPAFPNFGSGGEFLLDVAVELLELQPTADVITVEEHKKQIAELSEKLEKRAQALHKEGFEMGRRTASSDFAEKRERALCALVDLFSMVLEKHSAPTEEGE